jgi:hypothetical protein
VSKLTGAVVQCDPSSTKIGSACPAVRIEGYQGGNKVVDDVFSVPANSFWQQGWNSYKVDATVSKTLAQCDTVSVGIRNYSLDWNLILDNLSLVPL